MQMISNSDYKWFYKAEQMAHVSDFKKQHIGAVAVYHGQLIGVGCNTNRTHPLQKYYDDKTRRFKENGCKCAHKLHAEMAVLSSIKNLDIDFSKVKLYIFRQRKDIKRGLARPCPSCEAAIRDLGIKNVYYSTNGGFAYEYFDEIGGDAA